MTEKELHPTLAAAQAAADKNLVKLAPKIAKAQPKTSNAVLSLFKGFVPMLGPTVAGLIAKYGGDGKVQTGIIALRDVTLAAYPLDEYPQGE